ncbi:MAG: sugar-transfer associated ATP-grasp domain-containing protein [Bulleidia sp.]|nr:sugar-transfer associated ATP-grasp domain-containing protein [Bulleidia sp.]
MEESPAFGTGQSLEWGGVLDHFIYGSSIADYFELGFYQMGAEEKKTYYTQRFADVFDFALDTHESIDRHNSKIYEYKHLKKYFKRDQLVSDECSFEEFAAFCKKHPVFFYKPDEESCGTGIERISVENQDLHAVYERIKKIRAVIDEPVIQHPLMESLCPGCINTVRVITAKVDGKIHIMGTAIRMGNGKNVADNYALGGYGAALDKDTGVIIDRGIDHCNRRYDEHPFSHVRFKGFQVPMWDQVMKLVFDAHMDYDLNYCGWDIAVRENDCVLIEANPRPMIDLTQVAGNGGKRARYQEVYELWKETDGRK